MSELEATEERDDDIPAWLAPFFYMTARHVQQATDFLHHQTCAIVEFNLVSGFIRLHWPNGRHFIIHPWDDESTAQLNDQERRAVISVWRQMVDDLSIKVSESDLVVVGQESRKGPPVIVPPRVWSLYRVEDWDVGSTNESGSGDRLFGVHFRAPQSDASSRIPAAISAGIRLTAESGLRSGAEVVWMAAALREKFPDGDPVKKGLGRERILAVIKEHAGQNTGSLKSLDRARAEVWKHTRSD